MKNKEKYIPVLDSLRGFAALSVCLYHFVYTTTGYVTSPFLLKLFSYGQYGVPLFFVISGFVIPWSMYNAGYKLESFFTFLLKRFLRLEPPYLFSLLIVVVLLVVRQHFYATNEHPVKLAQVFLHLGYVIPFTDYKWLNPVYWTLAIEFQYYFFIALIYPLLVKDSLYVRILIYLTIIGTSFTTGAQFLPCWLPVFFVGVVLFLFKVNKIKKTEFLISSFFLLCSTLFRYEMNMGIFAFALIGFLSILFFEGAKVPGISKIGKWSYSLYLTHTIVGATVINVLSHRFTESWQKFVVIVLGTCITLFFSWLMYLFVEAPSKKLSSKIKIGQKKNEELIFSKMIR